MNAQQPQPRPQGREPAPPPLPRPSGRTRTQKLKFETSLATHETLYGTKENIERIMREGFTAKDVGCIVGLDKQDEGAILISRESWKRLEVFIALLSGVEMSISEEKLKEILERKT